MEEEGEAGSFFGSESEPAQEQESQHVVEQGAVAADSVNYGAQSPRVPRSQISRAHPGQTLGYAERTSAVLSALSGDDETALSAAEAAGEHTSHPVQPAAGGAPAASAPGAAAAAPGPAAGPSQQQQQQQGQPQAPALPPVAAAGSRLQGGAEDPLSPPESTSPMYRANSVVSHTAAPLRIPALKRAAETPMSALVGASPTTSRVELSQRLPFGPPPAAGRRQQPQLRPPSQQQQQQQPLGPSYVSLSHLSQQHQQQQPPNSSTAPLASTLGVAIGAPPAPVFAPPPVPAAGAATAASQPAVASNLVAWVGLAASMGVPLEALQAQGSAIQGSGGQLQQAEALQNMAAVLQAQASVILQQQQQQQLLQAAAAAAAAAQQHHLQTQAAVAPLSEPLPAASAAALPSASAAAPPAASAAPVPLLPPLQTHNHHHGPLQPAQPQHAVVIEASAGGASMYSMPDLVGASVIHGHPLPPPFFSSGAAGLAPAATAPTLVSGVTPPPHLPGLATAPAAAAEAAAPQPSHELPHVPAAPAAGSTQQPGSGNRGSASPTAGGAADQRLLQQLAPAQASSMVRGQYRPPRSRSWVQPGPGQRGTLSAPEPAGAAAAPADAAASAGRQGSALAGEQEQEAPPGMPSTDAAAIGGVPSTDAAAIGGNLGGDEAANDGLEVQQAAPSAAPGVDGTGPGTAPDTGDDQRQEAGAAEGQQQEAQKGGALPPAPHGAASVMATLVSSGEQSDVESEISAPHSHPVPAAAQSPLPSMQPAAATTNAHMSMSLVAATASQPAPKQQAKQQGAGSARRQRSVSEQQSPQREGAAGSRLATVETGGMDDDAAGGSVDMTAPAWQGGAPPQLAASAPLPGHAASGAAAEGVGGVAPRHQLAASAPTSLPGQAVAPDEPQPAISVSLSAHGNDAGPPGHLGHFAENNPVAPQAQSSAFVFKRQQRTSAGWEEHHTSNMPPPPAPAGGDDAAMEGQGEGQPAEAAGGSPRGSAFNAQPAASAGTARGTILAGQAHSILTTAAAGDGEQGEVGEDGEALSPLVISRLAAAVLHGAAGRRAAGAVPATNSANLRLAASSPGPDQAATAPAAAAAAPAVPAPTAEQVEPMDFSTMAQDVGGGHMGGDGPAAIGHGGPEPTLLSGQPPTAMLHAQQLGEAAPQSSSHGGAAVAAGIGAGAESVQANGIGEAICGSGSAGAGGAEVAQHAPAPANGDLMHEEAGPHACGYASSIILGNGFLGAGAALGAAVVAAAATSEQTSPSLGTSVSGKRGKRKRG